MCDLPQSLCRTKKRCQNSPTSTAIRNNCYLFILTVQTFIFQRWIVYLIAMVFGCFLDIFVVLVLLVTRLEVNIVCCCNAVGVGRVLRCGD